MLAIEAIQWWYSAGLGRLIRLVLSTLTGILRTFSVPILIVTLFAPWKRIITYADRSIADHFKAMLDNLISRFVGFGVRIVVLFTAAVLWTLTATLGAIAIIAWPLAPFIGMALIAWGFYLW